MYGYQEGNTGELVVGITLFLLFLAVIPGLFIWILVRNLDNLSDAQIREQYGAMYFQLALDDKDSKLPGQQNHHVYIQPFVFFVRRSLFMAITVYAFDYPCQQMQLHSLTILAYLIYIVAAESNLYEDEQRNRVEVIAEMLNLMAVCTLQQCTRGNEFNDSQKHSISIVFLTTLALLVLLSITYAVYSLLQRRRAKKRQNELLDQRDKNFEEYRKWFKQMKEIEAFELARAEHRARNFLNVQLERAKRRRDRANNSAAFVLRKKSAN